MRNILEKKKSTSKETVNFNRKTEAKDSARVALVPT